MKMLADTVLVMEHKGRDASDGGIILPEGSKQRTYKGSVIAVGPGKPLPDGGRYPMTVRVGDVVAYPERTGDKLKIDGQEMLAIPEDEVYSQAEIRLAEHICECGEVGPHKCKLTQKAKEEYDAHCVAADVDYPDCTRCIHSREVCEGVPGQPCSGIFRYSKAEPTESREFTMTKEEGSSQPIDFGGEN